MVGQSPQRPPVPEPVLTVTANTALDRVILVPDFAFGRTVVATGCTLAMAGKPADVSLVLAELGVASHATGLAGGRTGRFMSRMLRRAGVRTSFLRVPGHTRVNLVVVKAGTGQQGTITVPSLRPRREDGERLYAHVLELLPGRKWLVLGGSLPTGVEPDLYSRLIEAAHASAVRTLLDASGRTLAEALPARPAIVKPNEIELGAAIGRELHGPADVLTAARELCARGVETVIVTMGAQGSICVSGEQAWHIAPLPVAALNTAGAGDAFGAGLLKGLLDGLPLPEALRWATATATATVLTLGTAECHREDVERLLPLVQVEPLAG
jgi:1-phosphofructokinase